MADKQHPILIPRAVEAPEEPAEKRKACPLCHTTLRNSASYCDRCGQKLDVSNPIVKLEDLDLGSDPSYVTVAKGDDEHRYTLGVLYTPDEIDAHDEFTDALTLQKAVWDYVSRGDLELRKMHDDSDGAEHIGDVVEIMCWPEEATFKLVVPGEDEEREVTVPAGTAYVGVIWNEDVWPDVKAGKYAGYSLGGKTVRIYDAAETGELEPMGKSAGRLLRLNIEGDEPAVLALLGRKE